MPGGELGSGMGGADVTLYWRDKQRRSPDINVITSGSKRKAGRRF